MPNQYINREFSWLQFNKRVLDQANDETTPLLERLKFLAITSSNLDEFFMIRVGGINTLARKRSRKKDPSGLTPLKQLQLISTHSHQIVKDQYNCFTKQIEPELNKINIKRIGTDNLSPEHYAFVKKYFEEEIFPVVTPMPIDQPDNKPKLRNLTLHLAVKIKTPVKRRADKVRTVVIPFGISLPRFIRVDSTSGYHYILIEDILTLFADKMFPGENIEETAVFRLTRNADLQIEDDLAVDLLSEIEHILDARKESLAVRLEIAKSTSDSFLASLQKSFGVTMDQTYKIAGPIDLSMYMKLATIEGFEKHKFIELPPIHQVNRKISIFNSIAKKDIILIHPYDNYEPVIRLVREASDDPRVIAIKQILYRTSKNSPIIAALINAANQGKNVTVIVELKARFDEARNLDWARKLEHAGVQVIYGIKNYKTHAKICLIVRRETQGIVRYIHYGTGNYNEQTAGIYSDVSFMTCKEELGADASKFFNIISGLSQSQDYNKISAAPTNLREKLLEMIDAEIERKKQGQKALIMAKFNSLTDPILMDALYRASNEGVKIMLNIRGICCLRPGVKKLSENIQVTSIVDRFLEHARVFYFHHGGEEKLFISSSDWMERNLDKRIELLVPIDDISSKNKLTKVLKTYFDDNVKAQYLNSNGNYTKAPKPTGKKKRIQSQLELYQNSLNDQKKVQKKKTAVFEPHTKSI